MTGIAIPETAEELEELLNDDKRVGEVMVAGQLAEFNRKYMEKALAAKGAELAPQMREQLQLGEQQFFQGQAAAGFGPGAGFRPGGTPAGALTGRAGRAHRAVARSRRRDAAGQVERQALFNERAMGAVVDDESYANSFGEFLYATHKAEKAAEKRGDTGEVTRIQDFKQKLSNALGERVPAEGGFLVPENLRSEILMVALETAVMRPRARVVPMDSLRVPLPSVDDISHANSVYGGVQAFWTEEGATLQASAPSFGRVVLEAKKLTAYTSIPNELLQDSVTSLATWFNSFFPKAIAWFEDVAFISGTGAGEPQGFLNAPAAVKVGSSGGANTLAFADIATMYSQMWPASLNNAVWLCSPDTFLLLLQMSLSSSVAPPLFLQGYQAIDHPGGGNGDGVNYMLMGRPLIVSEKMPSSASGNSTVPGALTFIDPDYYLLGDRQTMQVASSDEYLFGQDMVAYRIIERLDGRFWMQSAITPENGSASQLSPLVLLNTT